MKMKIKYFVLPLFLLLFPIPFYAQGVRITPKKVIYRRPKPEQDFKKTFVITYPQVRAATPALSRKIESTISFARNNNLNLKEELGEYQWLESADYVVNYNKNNLLDITLSSEGSGAYPSTFNKTVVVNLKTGNRLRPVDVFTNLAALAAEARKKQLTEIKTAQAEYKNDSDAADFDGEEYFRKSNFTVKDLSEFSVSDQGVTFLYDYGFPHVVLALQPEGRYFFTWAQMKPYIKRNGLFAQFIR